MQSTVLIRIAGTAVLGFLTVSEVQAEKKHEHQESRFTHYRVIDLGTLGGVGTNSAGFGTNEKGWVAGSSNVIAEGPQHAFLWRYGQMADLGTLGGASSGASAANTRGEVVLSSETSVLDPNGEDFCQSGTQPPHQCLAAVWKDGALTALPTLMGYDQTGHPVGNSQAYDLNRKGQVIGFSENGKFDSCLDQGTHQMVQFEAVVWEPNGEIRELQPPPGDTVAFAWGINDKGQAVGASGLCSSTAVPPNLFAPHAVLWEKDGTPINLGGFGGAFSIATAINNRGEVVGGAQSSQDGMGHIFLWTKSTGMQDLGTFPGAAVTVAPCCNTINDSGQIVGFWIDSSGNSHAFVWQDKEWMDLNKLIPENSPWSLQAAQSINDAGEITGSGIINGESHAFLAVPCHEHEGRHCCEHHDR
jgi:probable HAF family extracellular repeat protein